MVTGCEILKALMDWFRTTMLLTLLVLLRLHMLQMAAMAVTALRTK